MEGFDIVPIRSATHGGASRELPDLDAPAGKHFTFRQLFEVGETFARLRPDNPPREPETYDAMRRLCAVVLDPVVDVFGPIELTYGFAGPGLVRHIDRRIDKTRDQHAGYEKNRVGRPICSRGGQAVDFRVPGVSSKTVADWIVTNTAFDRLYFYGADKPLHVSVGPEESGVVVRMAPGPSGRLVPRVVGHAAFLGAGR